MSHSDEQVSYVPRDHLSGPVKARTILVSPVAVKGNK